MNIQIIDEDTIKNKIFTVRGLSVMVDKLNFCPLKRGTIPKDNCKSSISKGDMMSIFKIYKIDLFRYMMTVQGVSMLSAVLKSDISIDNSRNRIILWNK